MSALTHQAVQPIIDLALREDGASRDLTSRAVVPPALRIKARLIAKAPGILAGGQVAVWTFQAMDRSLRCSLSAKDGTTLVAGQAVLTVEGRARSILAAERAALNLLGHLSGIATLTRQFAERARGTGAAIYDTRKTLPGLRTLEKYAVRVGGGENHRASLAEAVLIKTNHLKALSTQHTAHSRLVQSVVAAAKQHASRQFVEIEVANMSEFKAALETRPDIILLDNWRMPDIRRAVKLRDTLPRPTDHDGRGGHASRFTKLEVSGGVTLANVRAIAKSGVDRISIGRLTHSAPALGVALRVVGRLRTP